MKKLHGAIVRTLLISMGVPVQEQSKSAVDRMAMLEALAANDKQRFEDVYQIIVNNADPRSLGVEREEEPGLIAKQEIVQQVRQIFFDAQIDMSNSNRRQIADTIDSLQVQVSNELIANRERTIKAIEEESKKFRKVQIKVGRNAAKTLNFTAPKEFDDMVALAANRINIMIVGPAGCGKTFISEKVAEALGLDYSSQSCSEGMSESALTGWLLPVGESGRFSYVPSEFVRIYENGGVFLFDEMDAADPNVLVFMNKAIANEGFYLPQRYEKPFVKKHKDFVAMAATNTFGHGGDIMYVGRNQLDEATKDRFRIGTVAMDYDDAVEESLIGDDILEWGRNVREVIKRHKLRRIMSTRVMIDSTVMALVDWPLNKIKNHYYADWTEAELAMIGGKI